MPGLSGRITTYASPNYHGELFSLTPSDTPFLSAIGGLTGGKRATGTVETEWQAADLREGAVDRQRLEGADAQTATGRSRLNISNVLEIHQETVDVSYTKLAAVQQYSGINIGASDNPVTNEAAEQITSAIKSKALDIENVFFNGKYQKPSDNTTARKTRGLIQAATAGINSMANVKALGTVVTGVSITASTSLFAKSSHGLVDNDQIVIAGGEVGGFSDRDVYFVRDAAANNFKVAKTVGGTAIVPDADVAAVTVTKTAALDSADVLDLMQKVWENGGIRESDTATLFVGAAQKRALTAEFITGAGYVEQTRNIGGVNMQTLETDFGRVNLALSRYVPKSTVVVCSLEQCAPRLLEIPGKGVFFVEPLAKTGASDRSQLYGEIGLEYGSPLAHGVLTGCKA